MPGPYTSNIAWGAVLLLLLGCNREPTPVAMPQVSAKEAGQRAISSLDQDDNGVIDEGELLESPALRAAQTRIDTDNDGQLSAEEIAARIRTWQETGLGTLTVPVVVTLDGAPLEGAQVTFEPEKFLGEAFKPGTGLTKPSGKTTVTLAEEDLADAGVTGVPPGFYTVRISKFVDGQESIPPRYNRQSMLGVEVALDTEYANSDYVFELETQP